MNKFSTQKNTILGSLLNKFSAQRAQIKHEAIEDLWRRNGLSNPRLRQGYKLAETPIIDRDGVEIVEYRLYKLVDQSTTRLCADISATIIVGSDVDNGSETPEQDN